MTMRAMLACPTTELGLAVSVPCRLVKLVARTCFSVPGLGKQVPATL